MWLHAYVAVAARGDSHTIQLVVYGLPVDNNASDSHLVGWEVTVVGRAVLVNIDVGVVAIDVRESVVATRYICIIWVCGDVTHSFECYKLAA